MSERAVPVAIFETDAGTVSGPDLFFFFFSFLFFKHIPNQACV